MRRNRNLDESWNRKIGHPDNERPDEVRESIPTKPADSDFLEEVKRTFRKVVDRIRR